MTTEQDRIDADTTEILKEYGNIFRDTVKTYTDANEEWFESTYLNLIYGAFLNLRKLVEDPEEKGVTWGNKIGVQLEYPLTVNWEDLSFTVMQFTKEDARDADAASTKIAKGVLDYKNLYVLKYLTKEVTHIQYKDGHRLKLDIETNKRIERAKGRKKENLLYELAQGYKTEKTFTLPQDESLGQKRAGNLSIRIQIFPPFIDTIEKVGYCPILLGFKFKGINVKKWPEEAKTAFWDSLLKGLKDILPEETFPQLPKPEAKPAQPLQEIPYIKAGLHLERQKFGKTPDPRQGSIFDILDPDSKKNYTESNVEIVGIDVGILQNKCIHAIQTLLAKTDYLGNLPPGQLKKDDNSYHYEGAIPRLRFKIADYLDAYGVAKRVTDRGFQEYNANERAEALKTLRDLGQQPFLFVYDRQYEKPGEWTVDPETKKRYQKKGEWVSDAIRTVRPLFIITEGYEALTKTERESLSSTPSPEADQKLKTLAVELSPIFVDQIGSHFVLKRANYQQEIRLLAPHASKYIYRFIDWLYTQRHAKYNYSNPEVSISSEALAYALRMDAWLKNKQWQQIRGSLNKCYEIAKKLGYLLDYEADVKGRTKDIERLTLNPDKFYQAKGKETDTALPASSGPITGEPGNQ